MKKLYSAPIADLIETEMDNVLAGISFGIDIDDPHPGPTPDPDLGEAKPGGVFENDAKTTSIFDYE